MKRQNNKATSSEASAIFGVILCCIGIIALCFSSLPMAIVGAILLAVGSSLLKE